MEKKYLTSKQAAEYLGFSEGTLRNARVSGVLSGHKAPKYYRIGKSIRYNIDELTDWIDDGIEVGE